MINRSTAGDHSSRASAAIAPEGEEAETTNKGIKTVPMTPFAASSTVVNLILATGPFNYPYGYVSLGPVISAPLLFITAILAYITATYLVEALSVAVAVKKNEQNEEE